MDHEYEGSTKWPGICGRCGGDHKPRPAVTDFDKHQAAHMGRSATPRMAHELALDEDVERTKARARKATMILSDKEREATVALVKKLAADLSYDTGRFAQTIAAMQQHLKTLADDREAAQGFGVTDRAGRK